MFQSCLFFILFYLCSNLLAQVSEAEHNLLIQQLKAEFSEEVEKVYNLPLVFKQWDARGKGFVQCTDSQCEIIVYSGLLKSYSLNHVRAFYCHEIGHLLGVKHTNISKLAAFYKSPYAVEGEADYYSTSQCLKRITNYSSKELEKVSYDAIAMTLGGAPKNLDGKNPYQRDLALGTNMTYPSKDCRYASLIAGVYLNPRPSCWYVPNKLIPPEFRIHNF